MKHKLTALVAGFIFGIGLTISQMINPAKVIGFLDILGDWDPSLALVMIGALIITAIGYRLAGVERRRSLPSGFRFRAIGKLINASPRAQHCLVLAGALLACVRAQPSQPSRSEACRLSSF